MDILHVGSALGSQTRDHQRRACTQVVGPNHRAVELIGTGDDGCLTVDLNIRAHGGQLGAVAEETGLVHILRQAADTAGQGHTHTDLCLHIRGEAGIGTGLNGSMTQLTAGHDADGIVIIDDPRTHFLQLGSDAVHVLGDHVLYQHVAACGHNGCQICTGLDLVGDDGIAAAPQLLHATDLHRIRTGAGNPGAHGIEEVGKVHDVGLFGGIFNHRLSGNQAGRHHDIHGGTDADHVQSDTAAMQAVRTGGQVYIVLGLVHVSTQRDKALDMLVNGTGGEVAATGQRHVGMVESAEQRAHQVITGAHLPHKYGVGMGRGDIGAVQRYNTGFAAVHHRTQILQNVQQDADIGNIRHVFYTAFTGNQQRGRQNCHRGIFGTVDGDGAFQGFAAVDHIFCQG